MHEITLFVTQGTATESSLLRSHENNYLAAVCWNGSRAGIAHVDVSTGEFRATELDANDIAATLENLNAREVLVSGNSPARPGIRTTLDDWVLSSYYSERTVCEYFRLFRLDD